ncbi:hypothetical protein Gotur_003463 [Gossypium turneri]
MNTVRKRPNKRNTFKSTNPNQGFVTIPSQISFYPNQGYYIPYPMVRHPIGTLLSFIPQPLSQLPWSQDPNSEYQVSYAEIIKGVEKFCASENSLKPQQIQEIKYIYNPGLPSELYNFINEIYKSNIY